MVRCGVARAVAVGRSPAQQRTESDVGRGKGSGKKREGCGGEMRTRTGRGSAKDRTKSERCSAHGAKITASRTPWDRVDPRAVCAHVVGSRTRGVQGALLLFRVGGGVEWGERSDEIGVHDAEMDAVGESRGAVGARTHGMRTGPIACWSRSSRSFIRSIDFAPSQSNYFSMTEIRVFVWATADPLPACAEPPGQDAAGQVVHAL